jgi:hypothetical protein
MQAGRNKNQQVQTSGSSNEVREREQCSVLMGLRSVSTGTGCRRNGAVGGLAGSRSGGFARRAVASESTWHHRSGITVLGGGHGARMKR